MQDRMNQSRRAVKLFKQNSHAPLFTVTTPKFSSMSPFKEKAITKNSVYNFLKTNRNPMLGRKQLNRLH